MEELGEGLWGLSCFFILMPRTLWRVAHRSKKTSKHYKLILNRKYLFTIGKLMERNKILLVWTENFVRDFGDNGKASGQ